MANNTQMPGPKIRLLMTGAVERGCLVAALLLSAVTFARAEPVHIVVPGRVYADLAEAIGGTLISISVIEPRSPSADRAITFPSGSLVLCTGTRADAWLREAASHAVPAVKVIEVYRPTHSQDGSIAFPWYDLAATIAFSHAIATELASRKPAAASRVDANLSRLLADFKAIEDRVNEVAKDYARSDVIVADDLSRDVARQLKFKTKGLANQSQQNMPAPAAPVEDAILRREGSIFLYDKDVPNPGIKRLIAAATDSGIPVVALQENLPTGLHYQRWALRQWNTIHGALNEAAP